MSSFPEIFNNVLNQLAVEYNLKIAKETHYETINRELIWFEGNIQKRINLTFMGDFIDITYYKTFFTICPKICLWLHNNIPMFPLLGKITYLELDKLMLDKQVNYPDKLKSYIEYAMKN